ncbi:uncharacterized protein KY384_002511 [Bacidia gigantensis]|uniref:uncharacterized protein n=1 Tax=Bacidia gigantensis TaxID=2732470 RepID=UPI001D05B07A|nr:uncharacterized protein KY384_002511 [Bacidia gigantensis]KAG8532634.1 hypothetical protein KY384_002511 [Bacidia gigantensis]
MSSSEDFIDFDIIETHKENIQPLASGRSAKALFSTFAPSLRPPASTPGDTRTLNDAIREEYEIELRSSHDSDDPLDVYDRYVKWTLGAYPSAQATSESQLRPLLERATKTFRSVAHYKNDPRYLKLWLHYIRFFSDAPRETFVYLSRHSIGESLALFYEEFATWFEGAGRWQQAQEVFQLGIDREARPTERLVRKFEEFKHRFEARVSTGAEPSSPAVPTVRPALAAKVDPFAPSTPQGANPQAARPTGTGGPSISKGGKPKLAIFSDAEGSAAQHQPSLGGNTGGWDSIGTFQERRRENAVEPKPWAGEILKTGKKSTGPPKMTIWKDGSRSLESSKSQRHSPADTCYSQIQHPGSSKIERTFVVATAIYPQGFDRPDCEMSIEELRAKARGWLDRTWNDRNEQTKSPSIECRSVKVRDSATVEDRTKREHLMPTQTSHVTPISPKDAPEITIAIEIDKAGRGARPKRVKVKEIKEKTQTVRINLDSPAGPKLRRKPSSEPTMTLHTRAATDDILDIFNQPLRNVDPMAGPTDSDSETDLDDDDDYTSAGESTGTGRISSTSEFGDTERSVKTTVDSDDPPESVSPWSDFTASKHVPQAIEDGTQTEVSLGSAERGVIAECDVSQRALSTEGTEEDESEKLPSHHVGNEGPRTKYIPLPPEDYEPPAKLSRDPAVIAQTRLPFMTPILERTETSIGAVSTQTEKDYFNSRTPCRNNIPNYTSSELDALNSPFQDVLDEHIGQKVRQLQQLKAPSSKVVELHVEGPIIKDPQCNPVDDSIRQIILNSAVSSLRSCESFHDHRQEILNKGAEIRKFIKSLSRSKSSDRTASVFLPPTLRFPGNPAKSYTIRRELGKGAFAPVYLAEQQSLTGDDESTTLVAIKSEDPPTAWEFHIMNSLRSKLSVDHPALASLLQPSCLHLFKDEGYLIEEYIDQGTLLDLVNLAKSDPISGQSMLDESIAMFFTIELLRTVEAMHSIGILHGDLKADNCLVRLCSITNKEEDWDAQYQSNGSGGWSSRGLTLIDFGRSIDMTAFRSDVQFIADWKTGKQDCVEMRELRPWTYQVDYFGIAGVVHSLLFGKYIEDMAIETKGVTGLGERRKYKIREGFKRYWQTDLWAKLFDLSLNPLCHLDAEEREKMPCTKGLKEVRGEMERWLIGEGGRRNGGLKNGLLRLEGRIRERKTR